MSTNAFSLRARFVFPVSSEPIENGCVTVDGDRITATGTTAPADSEIRDLGEVALLPGLINAHTHLELSNFDCPLGEPGIRLADWLSRLVACRDADPQWDEGATLRGLHECLHAGCTSLADIVTSDGPHDEFAQYPIRATVFQELIVLTPERVEPALELARKHLASRPDTCWQRGLSPHAPYTVRPELLEAVVDLAKDANAPVAMHLAESFDEIELMATGTGPLFDLLRSRDAWSPGLVSPPVRPMDYLRQLAEAPRALVIHGNYLDAAEWQYLADRRDRMSVVYCPRSHEHFRHALYPLANMLAAGVNVCLGTDSRASAPDLSLLGEMRFVAARHGNVPASTILELGTLAGARGLGCDAEVGTIEPGKRADLTAVALSPDASGDPYRMLLHGTGSVVASWIGGRIISASA